jgi:putative DNA methylase
MKKAFIEFDFPVKEVSKNSAREKNIRHGHISTLHIWWARRPLAASRATIYASLVPAPKDEKEREERSKFIAELSKWENSNNIELIEKARQDIMDANGGVPPKVLDPFSGGGAIPLEALRLGCETYASDLNPVAITLQKAVMEYIPIFNKKITKEEYQQSRKWINEGNRTLFTEEVNPLLEDLKYEINKIYKELTKNLKTCHSSDKNGNIAAAYIWVRTIKCTNIECAKSIPLIKQTWLSKKNKVAYKIIVKNGSIKYEIRKGENLDFDPTTGTISRGNVNCPFCNTGIASKNILSIYSVSKFKEQMIVVVEVKLNTKGKKYRIAEKHDEEAYKKTIMLLEKECESNNRANQHKITPDESLPRRGTLGISPYLSSPKTWSDLFNTRQLYSAILLCRLTKNINYEKYSRIGKDYIEAINTFLAIIIDRIVDKNANIVVWDSSRDMASHVFGRHAIQMVWDYAETNIISGVFGDYKKAADWVLRVVESNSILNKKAKITQSSATSLDATDLYYDAIFTDPPYYDNIPYAYISDFFYVWLKRTLLNTDYFNTPLTPKSEELVSYRHNHENSAQAKEYYEKMLYESFKEMNRVIKDNGILYIVYAHKSTEAWETIINAILRAKFYLTGSWPIHTEMQNRLRASNSAALASSIYMVCRKRNTDEIAYYNEIKPTIERRVHKKLDQFWAEGIGGSDFFISAIGPAVEEFGKYASVEKLSGEKVTVKELLEHVRKVVSEHALNRILKNTQLGGIDNTTRFYLIWRFTYGNAKVLFDDASKLSRAIGFDIEANWDSAGIVNKQAQWISIKDPNDRRNDETFNRRIAKHFPEIMQERLFEDDNINIEPPSMIDVLHQCLIFWGRNDRLTIVKLLEGSGYRTNNNFWQVAQSISDVLPEGEQEKQLLQGFLYGKEGYQTGKIPVDNISEPQANLFGDEE